MASASFHHVGLQVSHIERSGEFYCAVFGARWLVRPVTFAGPGADQAMGTEGVRLRLAMVGIADGAIELFQFLGDLVPDWAGLPRAGRLPHLALQVEDTDAALERVEAAGGKRVWPAVDRFGAARVVYVADPDGNVVELLDRPPSDIAGALVRWFPDGDPARA